MQNLVDWIICVLFENMSADYSKGLIIEYFNLSYNILEAIAAIIFGSLAGSVALIGFGLDSIVESLSAVVLIWRLHQHGRISEEEEARIEFIAVRMVAITFFILAIYVLYESLDTLIFREIPDPSLPGIILASLSILIMPTISLWKRRIGKRISSKALVADAKETMVCATLSVALLLGLGMNYLLGWWWADPVVGLVIVVFLIKEGLEQWKEAGEDD